MNVDYWKKQSNPPKEDLSWNFPEQKRNEIAVIGGNSGGFSAPIKTAEYLAANFPLKRVKTILPDAIQSKFPPAAAIAGNLNFVRSTPSGSLDKSEHLNSLASSTDFNIFIGDLSKNSITATAIANALGSNIDASNLTAANASADATAANIEPGRNKTPPAIITRDTIDLLLPEMPNLIERKDLFIIGSLAQIQKLFRAVYYPKVLLLSQPLFPVIETLHKFTLTYPNLSLLTFHDNQIIIAKNGKITTVPITSTKYSPILLWSGELAAKIAVYNLWNPNLFEKATTAAIFAK